jgi:hypothetical protein
MIQGGLLSEVARLALWGQASRSQSAVDFNFNWVAALTVGPDLGHERLT